MNYNFESLCEIVKKLRDPITGCPWDKAQTAFSLVPNFIEELYEMIEAIENQDNYHIAEELGDILLHVVLQLQIAEENKAFTSSDVFKNISEKLIRRHPHIFADTVVHSSSEVKLNWEKIKMEEKVHRSSVLEGIPTAMPALIVAQRTQEKAASVGFDWDSIDPVFDKFEEETIEIKSAIANEDQNNIEEEIGDLLFTIVNLSRKLGFDAESALRKSNQKFTERFKKVEAYYKNNGLDLESASLEEMDEIWNKIKK